MTSTDGGALSEMAPEQASVGSIPPGLQDCQEDAALLESILMGPLSEIEETLITETGFEPRTVATLLDDRGLIGVRTLLRSAGRDVRYSWAAYVALAGRRREVDPRAETPSPALSRGIVIRLLTEPHRLPPGLEDRLVGLLSTASD